MLGLHFASTRGSCAPTLAPVLLQAGPWAPAPTKPPATAGPGAECVPTMALSSGCRRSSNFFAAASPKALGGAERLRLSRSVSPQGCGGCRCPPPIPRVNFLHPVSSGRSQVPAASFPPRHGPPCTLPHCRPRAPVHGCGFSTGWLRPLPLRSPHSSLSPAHSLSRVIFLFFFYLFQAPSRAEADVPARTSHDLG